MRVRAAVLTGVNTPFQVTDVALAPPRSGEVLVKIAASGLCGSDLNVISGKRKLVPFPAVIGHEASGVVAGCGPDVERLRPGDSVVLSIVPSCGTCHACILGQRNYCAVAEKAMAAGTLLDGTRRLSADGGELNHFLTVSSFAEYAVVPESGAVVIPEGMPLDQAALLGCGVLTGFGAVHNTAAVSPGSRVAVFGCGGVGLNIVQGARLAGAARIIAIDIMADKLALAQKLGATDTVDASSADPVAAVRDLVGGADFAFEALGRDETIQQAWSSLDIRGKLVLVGLLPGGARLTLDTGPFLNEQSVQGCYFGSADLSRDVPVLVEHYLHGDLVLDDLISRRITLDELDEAVEDMRAGRGVRSVLVFDS